jgi:hypothetical protein
MDNFQQLHEFNPNYLGHSLIHKPDNNVEDYYCCSRCNVAVNYGRGTKKYWIYESITGWKFFNMTCDEVIIKSIIE